MIECKSPSIRNPIQEAVEKNFARYQNRGHGYERLMFYNHFLIATCGNLARHGSIGLVSIIMQDGLKHILSLRDIKIMNKRN